MIMNIKQKKINRTEDKIELQNRYGYVGWIHLQHNYRYRKKCNNLFVNLNVEINFSIDI